MDASLIELDQLLQHPCETPQTFLMKPLKKRLDQYLVEFALAPSREKAQGLILSGKVLVNDHLIDKSGFRVPEGANVRVTGQEHPYVSRGGVKLEGALKYFGVNPSGWSVLDIGASTGGFTDCLLQQGASHVFAVDVGYGQLAWKLQSNPQVTSIERTNIRHLKLEIIGKPVDLVVVDVSFISLKWIFPVAWDVLQNQGNMIALVKPQFEAGPEEIGKGGKVTSPEVHQRVIQETIQFAKDSGFHFKQSVLSSIQGKKSGNQEFFIWLEKMSKTYQL